MYSGWKSCRADDICHIPEVGEMALKPLPLPQEFGNRSHGPALGNFVINLEWHGKWYLNMPLLLLISCPPPSPLPLIPRIQEHRYKSEFGAETTAELNRSTDQTKIIAQRLSSASIQWLSTSSVSSLSWLHTCWWRCQLSLPQVKQPLLLPRAFAGAPMKTNPEPWLRAWSMDWQVSTSMQ